MPIDTAQAFPISRKSVKWGCAREWGGWGQLSEDGPGQQNPDRSEGPWGRAACLLASQCSSAQLTRHRAGIYRLKAGSTKEGGKPDLKPYWEKPTVRNFRGDDGNVGIIRSPVRAIALPDNRHEAEEEEALRERS